MFRHLVAFLRRPRRTRPSSLDAVPMAPAAKPVQPSAHDPFTAPASRIETGRERDPPSRQRLSWPARDLSRSQRLARAAPDDETVALRPPTPNLSEEDDDATVVLPRAPGRNTEPR